MKALALVASGRRKERDTTVRYEVHRERESGRAGVAREPLVEEFLGLDRARIAALGHALDGATATGDRFTGLVRIFQAICPSGREPKRSLIDVIDERVASRLLNEARLPRAGDLAVSLDQIQAEVDALSVD